MTTRTTNPSSRRERHNTRRARRGLSLVEMMIALSISSTLLASALVALDGMFKGYQQTTESASTHVVSRIVATRLMGMIRTGSDFGPIPDDILDSSSNPINADYFEFASQKDANGNVTQITRIEHRRPGAAAELNSWGAGDDVPESAQPMSEDTEPGELWFVLIDPTGAEPEIITQHPLLTGVGRVIFTLHFDVGPRLTRATIDMTIAPNDSRDLTIHTDNTPKTIRLVCSAFPRQSIE